MDLRRVNAETARDTATTIPGIPDAVHTSRVVVVDAGLKKYLKCPSQIVCRAVASLSDMLELRPPIMTDITRVRATKAARTERELATMPPHWQGNPRSLNIPGRDEPRTLVVVERRSD